MFWHWKDCGSPDILVTARNLSELYTSLGCLGIADIAGALISWLQHKYVRFVHFPGCLVIGNIAEGLDFLIIENICPGCRLPGVNELYVTFNGNPEIQRIGQCIFFFV